MPPLTHVIYAPSANFFLHRQRLARYWFHQPDASFSFDGETITAIYSVPGYTATIKVKLYANSVPWNSNCYSLGWLIVSSTYSDSLGALNLPYPLLLSLHQDLSVGQWVISLGNPAIPTTNPDYVIELEHKPTGYWDPVAP